ncbi:MAG TPA: ParA family protein [Thermoanaerobaculia bacterium]|jgi:cellulose biosynthesis protein BcsQ|nr:ParA family protein [Thermoanaerobaculia bacterium]
MKTIAFFNNKGGVGKTTLVYHLASMIAERGETVLAVDLDPQANLTSMFLTEEQLEPLWQEGEHPATIFGAVRPIIRGIGDVMTPAVERINPRLGLVVGDLALSTFEDRLSWAWPNCHNRDESAFRIMTAFHRLMHQAALSIGAQWILIDVGPNLGAINRAALIASERVVIPLGPDLFSLQGLRNLGPALRSWRESWRELLTKNPDASLDLPAGEILPLGYVVMQHGMRENRPPKAYLRWIERFPVAYRESVLAEPVNAGMEAADDPYCLAMLKHYRSLMPMAMEARKPVFALKPADGAIGAHNEAVRRAYEDFQKLAARIIERSGGILH